jgi:NAD(P)-dependent dehydrogenase (short-subunit alcohol dehydrogenase family)
MKKIPSFFNLSGQVALVTGGGQNFGLEIATGLAEAGANLAITSRELDKAKRVAVRLRKQFNVRVLPLSMNLFNEDSIQTAFFKVARHAGRLDILVNNAGGHFKGVTGRLETEPLDGFKQYLTANLTGPFICMREAAKLMLKQKRGSIINIASVSSLLGRDRRVYEGTSMIPNPFPYTAAKAGMIGLTYDVAAYLGKYGIRVNAVSPGGFERGQPPAFIKAYAERTMLGRMGRDGQDLKGVVVFLASDAAAYVTGHNLYVDGGFSRFK